MYPFIRLAYQMFKSRKDDELPLTGTHVSQHICMPSDIDLWRELNNGRTLTIYDLGRIPLARRAGLITALRKNRWGLTMAGASVRYRSRVRLFQKIEMRSRAVGWDDKFIYLEQSLWRGETCCSHILYRSAVTDKNGIVPPQKVMQAMGKDEPSPPLPGWVRAWIAAESERPWPPMRQTPAIAIAKSA